MNNSKINSTAWLTAIDRRVPTLFVPLLTGFNFAETSRGTGSRVLDLYLSGGIGQFKSLGHAATEDFIEQVVLPRADTATAEQRNLLEMFIDDAGEALDRRYLLQSTNPA